SLKMRSASMISLPRTGQSWIGTRRVYPKAAADWASAVHNVNVRRHDPRAGTKRAVACSLSFALMGLALGCGDEIKGPSPDGNMMMGPDGGPSSPVTRGFVLVAPARLLGSANAGQHLAAGQMISVPVAGTGSIPPSGVVALLLNVTAINASAPATL